jgi:transcription factor MYB, plant
MHISRNSSKHAKQTTARNHIDLNKDPNINLRDPSEIFGHSEHSSHLHTCNVKDTQSCSKSLSLSRTIGQPEIQCEALIAENSAVALTMQGLKLDAVNDKVPGINLFREEGVEIYSFNVEALSIDRVMDRTCSGSSKPGGRTSNLCELSLMSDSSSSPGSLCYQIPTLDNIIPAHFTVFSRHHEQDHCVDGFQSPTGYSTSSPVDGNKLDRLSVQSILKSAAENFPGTPSILRRKREKPIDAQENNFDMLNGDSFHTPLGKCTTVSPHSFMTATFLSLGPPDGKGLSDALGSVDVSPSYRLRSKRMAVLKSIERHLDFSSDGMDNCSTANILKSASWNTLCTNSSIDFSSMPEKNMRGHMFGLELSVKDFAQTTKLDLN